MIRRLSFLLSAVTLILGAVVGIASLASAQSTSGSGLQVSPLRFELTIAKGKSKTVTINVQNVANGPVTLRPVVNDFEAGNNETGQPKLLLNNANSPTNSFKSLVSSKSLPTVTLKASQRKQISVTVSVPTNANSGGYYGVIRFTPVVGSTSDKNISLSGSVGTLFLITVPGHLVEQLQLSGFQSEKGTHIGSVFNSGPVAIAVRFHNTGNIHVAPFGKIIVKNMSGKVIDTEQMNATDPPGNVLPSSVRRFDVPLKHLGFFGRYTAIGSFGYGNKGQLLTAQATFYIIPWVWIAIIAILIILLSYFGPRALRAYNKKVLRNAARGNRR